MENLNVVVENNVVVEGTKKVSYRQDFIKVCSTLIDNKDLLQGTLSIEEELLNKFEIYFNEQINKTKTVSKGEYKPTEKAMTILEILFSYEGLQKTGKEIAEGSNGLLKANGVSGSIRGLVSNGFVNATDDKPKKYEITQKGIDYMNQQEQE